MRFPILTTNARGRGMKECNWFCIGKRCQEAIPFPGSREKNLRGWVLAHTIAWMMQLTRRVMLRNDPQLASKIG